MLIALLAVFAAVGGVPHVLQWIKAKPQLKIVKATITKLSNDNFRHHIQLEIENRTKWWRKKGDASNVIGEYYLIDKNGVQCGYVTGQVISPYLVAGAKVLKDIEGYHTFLPDGNPYTIVFRATCNENAVAKHTITYQAPQ